MTKLLRVFMKTLIHCVLLLTLFFTSGTCDTIELDAKGPALLVSVEVNTGSFADTDYFELMGAADNVIQSLNRFIITTEDDSSKAFHFKYSLSSFSQYGVAPDEEEEEDIGIFEGLLISIFSSGDADFSDPYPNNILTQINVDLTIINLEKDSSSETVSINASYEGGHREYSFDQAFKILKTNIRDELHKRFLIRSTILKKDGMGIIIRGGDELGFRKGMLFEIYSPDDTIAKDSQTIVIPGYFKGIVKASSISNSAIRTSTIRSVHPIEEQDKALELINPPIFVLANFQHYNTSPGDFNLGFAINWGVYSIFNWGFGFDYTQLTDSREHVDRGFSIHAFSNLHLLSFGRFIFYGNIELASAFVFRDDDQNNFVTGVVPSVSTGFKTEFILSRDKSINVTCNYLFFGNDVDWQYTVDEKTTRRAKWNSNRPRIDLTGIRVGIQYQTSIF